MKTNQPSDFLELQRKDQEPTTTHHADETHRLHRRGPAARDRQQLQPASRVTPLYQQQQQLEAQPACADSGLLDARPNTITLGVRVVYVCACATGDDVR